MVTETLAVVAEEQTDRQSLTAWQFLQDGDALRRASIGAVWKAVIRWRSQPDKPLLSPQDADIEDMASETRVRAIARVCRHGWREDADRTARTAISYAATWAVRAYVTDLARQGMGESSVEPSYRQRLAGDDDGSDLLAWRYWTDPEDWATAEAVIACDSVAACDVARELGISRQLAAFRLTRMAANCQSMGQVAVATVVCEALQELLGESL